jgi:outer membrane receptor protein involved in Fe transport
MNTANQMLSLRIHTDYHLLQETVFNISYRWLTEAQFLSGVDYLTDRDSEDRSFFLNLDKQVKFKLVECVFSYQFENSMLDFQSITMNPAYLNKHVTIPVNMQRRHHGIALITKLNAPSGADYVKDLNFDLSIRHDRVFDDFQNEVVIAASNDTLTDKNWNETIVKFSTNIAAFRNDLDFQAFFNFGANVKFPTLLQQLSTSASFENAVSNIDPETNKSIELGFKLTRDTRNHPNIFGWQLSGNYFKNDYENKIRMSYSPDSPITFYDNVPVAQISGIETASSLFLLKKKITVEFGLSRYFISEKAAFPFKYDMKRVLNFNVDHAGYSFRLHWFKEGEQMAWLRQPDGIFAETALSAYTNIDVHLKKAFSIYKLKLFANLSIRNLLDDYTILEDLTLRDRRFYISFGAQY